MEIDGRSVAARMMRLMSVLHLNQQTLAQQLHITQPAVSKYLQGRIPPAEILLKLARLGGVTVEWILTGSTELNKKRVAEPPRDYQTADDLIQRIKRLPPELAQEIKQLVHVLSKYC